MKPASIRAHLLRLVLVATVPLAAIDAWNLYASAESDAKQAREQVFHLAQITASETAKVLGQAHVALNGLAARPAVRALDPARCDPILKEFAALAPHFANVATIAMDARVVCSAAPLALPTRGDPDRFIKLLRGPDELTVGKVAPGVVTGRWVVPVGRPLLDAQGGIAGAVVLPLDLLKLSVLPSLEGLPANAVTGLVAADGTVLARSTDAARYVGTKAGTGRPAVRLGRGTTEVTGLDGIARIQGFTPVPGTDWIALASLPASEVYAGVRVRIAASALISIAILGTVLLLALRWGRAIRVPITALAYAANQVAAGNPAARAPLAGVAEIAAVAAEFNRMLDALDASERHYRDTLDNVHLGAVGLDTSGNVTYCNDHLLDLCGWRREEVLGRNWFDFALPDPAPIRSMFEQAMRDGSIPPHHDNEILTRAGERRLIHWNNTVLRDAAGAIIGTVSLGEDITERRRLEERNRAQHEELTRSEAEGKRLLALAEASRSALLNVLDDQKRTADALRVGEARYRTLIEQAADAIVIAGPDGRIQLVNARACEMFGYAPEEFVGLPLPAVVAEFERQRQADSLRRLNAGERITAERQFRRKDGSLFPGELSACRMEGGLALALVRDITERKAKEAAMRDYQERLRVILDTVGDPIFVKDNDHRIVLANQAFYDIFALNEEVILDKTLAENVPADERQHFLEIDRRVLDTGMPDVSEETLSVEGRATRTIVTRKARFIESSGKRFLVGSIHDITERKQAEAALRENRARLEGLTRQLLEVQEAERRTIARELHDEVGGVLTAVKLNLQSLRRKRPDEAALTDGIALVDGAIEAVRSISLDLRPTVLDDLGLIPALRWYCEHQALRAGIPIELALDAIDLKTAPQLESACYRIVQESVTNALRHADARRIKVALRRSDDGFEIEIADDGAGFAPTAARSRESSGLSGMEERAKLLGGRLAIDSAPGAGTRVRAEFIISERGIG